MAKTTTGAHVLWIDADPVFGGSGSQVQFPAELRGFFGLPKSPSIGDHVARSVQYGGVSFPAKKMDFHHNDVWRLNLPTAHQGLGDYHGKVLVFEKTESPDTYRLWAIERGSPIFRRVRMLSKSKGKVGFKRRENGKKREYGYF